MKFISNQRNLTNKINIAQRAINVKSTNELLRGLKISTKDGVLIISAYDAEISIMTSVEADVQIEGEVVVNSKLFGDIIRKLPDSFVEVETDDNMNIHIKCLSSNFTIKGMDASRFPQLPKADENSNIYTLDNIGLKNMIRQTSFAVSQDPTKSILMGELFEVDGNKMTLTAIDGYRFAVKSSDIENSPENIRSIIPGKTLNEINSLLEEDGNVELRFSEKNAFFRMDDTLISARLIDGEFIDYKKLLPREHTTRIRVNRREFLSSVERAALLFMSDKNNLIKLSIEPGTLTIRSNSDIGNVHEVVDIELEGNNLDIAFNSRYIIDGIKHIEDEDIYIDFTTNVNPCVIKSIDKDEYTYLLLPVRS